MSYEKYSGYRVMWLMVLFDLPTETKKERRLASKFRKILEKDGFNRFQFSVYIRHCPNKENLNVHKKRIKNAIPGYGKVAFFDITDKQFGRVEIFYNQKEEKPPLGSQQLEMF